MYYIQIIHPDAPELPFYLDDQYGQIWGKKNAYKFQTPEIDFHEIKLSYGAKAQINLIPV